MDGLDDEWDESFLDELIRAHNEAVASRNPNPTPAPTSAPSDPFSTAAVSYLPAAASYPSSAALSLFHVAAAPHASASASAISFSPPRELTQRPSPAAVAASGSKILALVPAVGGGFSPPRELSQRPAAEESDCEIIGVAGPAGADRFRGGAVRREREAREAERREVERLKKVLNRVSKQMNDLKNECSELKKDRTKKDIEIKAKEADIQNLKKANLGCASKDICSMGMDIDLSFHTPANGALHAGGSFWTSTRRAEKSNGKSKELSLDGLCLNERNQTDASEVLELKHRTMIDNSTSTSGGVSLEESAHLESKSNKCKEIKSIGVQTDLPWNCCVCWP